MGEMDYLLYAYAKCQNSDEVVTGKLFDYLGARRPILCLARACPGFGNRVQADIHFGERVQSLLDQLCTEHCAAFSERFPVSGIAAAPCLSSVVENLRNILSASAKT